MWKTIPVSRGSRSKEFTATDGVYTDVWNEMYVASNVTCRKLTIQTLLKFFAIVTGNKTMPKFPKISVLG